jgi:hypothetical protein
VLCFVFFFCLSDASAWSAPPSMGCGSLSLYVVLRFWSQLCSPPAILFWSWVLTVLVYWVLVSFLAPFLWDKASDLSASPLLSACCDGLLIIFQFCSVV